MIGLIDDVVVGIDDRKMFVGWLVWCCVIGIIGG